MQKTICLVLLFLILTVVVSSGYVDGMQLQNKVEVHSDSDDYQKKKQQPSYIKFKYNQYGEYHNTLIGGGPAPDCILSPDISAWGDSSSVASFHEDELVFENPDGRDAIISGTVFINQTTPGDFFFRVMVENDGVFGYPNNDFSIGVDVIYQDDTFERFSLNLPKGSYPYCQMNLPVPTGSRKPVKYIYPRIVFSVVGKAHFKSGELIELPGNGGELYKLSGNRYGKGDSFSQPECIYESTKITMADIGRINGIQNIIFQYSSVANVYNMGSIGRSIHQLKQYDILICSEPGEVGQDENYVTDAIKANVKIFGYLALGVTPPATFEHKKDVVDRVAAAGWYGVFIDCFGYDANAARADQNNLIDYIHNKGLRVFANGGSPEEALGNKADPIYNPLGTPTSLTKGDWYLIESFFYGTEGYREVEWEMRKSSIAKELAAPLGVNIACLSYTRSLAKRDEPLRDSLTSYLLAASFGFNAWHMAPYPDEDSKKGYTIPHNETGDLLLAPLNQIGAFLYSAETNRYYIVFDLSSGTVSYNVYDKQKLRRVKPGIDVYTSDDLVSWSPGAGKRWVRARKTMI